MLCMKTYLLQCFTNIGKALSYYNIDLLQGSGKALFYFFSLLVCFDFVWCCGCYSSPKAGFAQTE